MGAVNTHKRYFEDTFSPTSQPHSHTHKKPRTSSPPTPLPLPPVVTAPPKPPDPHLCPPPIPLSRSIQGPRRHIRVFGLGNPSVVADLRASWRFGGWKMGNWMSRTESSSSGEKQEAHLAAGSAGRGGGSSDAGLKLDEYKKLVEGLQEARRPVEEVSEDVFLVPKASPSASILAPKASPSASILAPKSSPSASILAPKTSPSASIFVPKTSPSASILSPKSSPPASILAPKASPSKAIVAAEDEKPVEEVDEGERRGLVRKDKESAESTPVREADGGWRTTKTPAYKELLVETSRKHDERLRVLDFEIKLAEKKVSAIRITREDKGIEEKHGPFAPLTEDDENDISSALQFPKRPSQLRDVLVVHEESNIEITREIIRSLSHGAWLNDEVINLYFELLKERQKGSPEKFLKCHFFNTFFYKKLTSGREKYDFKSVRRWTTQRKIGYSLIECDKIFVPIHKDIHWCLAVIDIKDKKFQYLDSLGNMDRGVLKVLARYLVDEVKDKNNKDIDVKSWKHEFVENLPLQQNGWDCGVFMIKYVDFFSRDLALSFCQDHMAYFRRRTVKEILRLKAN